MALATPIPALSSDDVTTSRVFDRLAVVVLCVVGIVALLTFRDYGLSWDDYTHSEYGDLLLKFYLSGLSDQRALSWVNLYYYGGGFDLLAALAAKLLPFTLFETRRLMGAAVGVLGLFVTWRIGRRVGGPLAGLVALVLLATCPLYYGHMFMNPKDSPFAVAMAIFLLGLVRTLEEYPRVSIASGALVGAGFGLAFGSRIMGAFGAIDALAALAFIFAIDSRARGIRSAAARLGHFVVALVPAMVLAYAVMALVWPWSVGDPLNPLRAVEYFSRFFEKPWQELFDGGVISVPDMPRSYVPTLFALKLPLILSVLGFGGAAGALVAAFRGNVATNRRAVLLLVALAALLPLAVTIALRPAMYNGIRHFVFVLPPLAVLGGLAAVYLIEIAARRLRFVPIAAALVLVVGMAVPVVEMVRLHPYEYTDFNWFSGGVAGARDRYMLDYWGLSFKQASQALRARLAERHETKPGDRRWKLAVCGPHRSPQVELGGDFETTWDPTGADFAMMLAEFYCAKLDAPLLAEIVRDGVTFARVYDIRGRSFPTLLTQPGL
ncbi:MAG TPA: glycosyltransferase family 39 protein [Xanthobacteraceae bacterium]|nr:glycosyltransferase family 39 protein [Xanthobacteraceae bacterium]